MTALTLHAHEIRRLLSHGSVLMVRPVKPQPEDYIVGDLLGQPQWYLDGDPEHVLRPPYAPGTKHWVRERFAIAIGGLSLGLWDWQEYVSVIFPEGVGPSFDLREEHPDYAKIRMYAMRNAPADWRSPATMPRWASRCDVIVRDVRVRRMRDVTYADCIAAGWVDVPRQERRPSALGERPKEKLEMEWAARYAYREQPGGAYIIPEWVWAVTVTRTPDSPAKEV